MLFCVSLFFGWYTLSFLGAEKQREVCLGRMICMKLGFFCVVFLVRFGVFAWSYCQISFWVVIYWDHCNVFFKRWFIHFWGISCNILVSYLIHILDQPCQHQHHHHTVGPSPSRITHKTWAICLNLLAGQFMEPHQEVIALLMNNVFLAVSISYSLRITPGTRIVYDRNALLLMRNSPLSKTPPVGILPWFVAFACCLLHLCVIGTLRCALVDCSWLLVFVTWILGFKSTMTRKTCPTYLVWLDPLSLGSLAPQITTSPGPRTR